MSYLLANGCSYTDKKFGVKSGNHVHTDQEKKEIGIPLGNWPMWPEYVAKKIGIEHINLAQSGAANARIHRTTLTQVQKKKPEVIMHAWTSAGRSDYMNEHINPFDFIRAIWFAGELLNRNPNVFENNDNSMSQSQLAFKMISIYYPNELNSVIGFYGNRYSDNNKIMNHLLQSIKVDDLPMWKRNADVYGFHNTMNGKGVEAMIRFWVGSFWATRWYSDNEIDMYNEFILNEDLRPILDTYYMCKAENIPFISIPAITLDPQSINCYYITDNIHRLEMLETQRTPYGRMDYLIEVAATGHAGNSNGMWKILEENNILKDKMNSFSIMTLCIRYHAKRRIIKILKNDLFKKIDELVYNEEYSFHLWPPFSKYNASHSIEAIIPGYKVISEKDGHPHPSMQEKIGELFYEIYQKKYS